MESYVNKEIFDRTIPKKFLRYIRKRDTHIVDLCKGKNVLHIGATDWPFTKERWERGDLLYVRIGEVSVEQLGIDLAKEGSEFLNEKHIPHSRILVRDMNELQDLEFTPDVIVFGDTLEHLMNLEIALTNLKKIMHKNTMLLISVPNAFYFMNFLFALFRKEHQHPDHSIAFTHKTLIQLIGKNDLKVQDFGFTFLEVSSDTRIMNWRGKIMYALVRLMTLISPVFAETLMVVVKK